MTKYADVRIEVTVCFDDDGETNLKDQALDAVGANLGFDITAADYVEVVGEVRDTPDPSAKP